MITAFRHPLRLARIAWVLSRHDALFPLETLNVAPFLIGTLRAVRRRNTTLRPGQRLAASLEALGPTFIKLGQALSLRSDLMGEDVAADLAGLQDRLPPFSAAEARAIIASEFDQPVEALFSAFNEDAVAAGSIAQVHKAKDSSGRDVAVKILRPGIEEAFARDINLLFWLADRVERRLPELRRLKPREVVQTLADTIRMELDLRFEAAAASEFLQQCIARNTESRQSAASGGVPLRSEAEQGTTNQFTAPAVDWTRISARVLTMEWIDGIPLSQLDAIRATGQDMELLLRHIAEGFFRQVFEHGFFHADLHPGNVFANADGTVTMVDFGIIGRLSHRDRLILAEVLHGFLERDYTRVARAHIVAGWVPPETSIEQFSLAMRAVGEPILERPLSEVSIGRLLGQLFHITETFHMETQPHLLMLQKSLVLVEGLSRMLCPNINMWELVRPVIEDWARRNLHPRARVKAQIKEWIDFAPRLPAYARRIESTLRRLAEIPAQNTPRKLESTPWHFYIVVGLSLGLSLASLWIHLNP